MSHKTANWAMNDNSHYGLLPQCGLLPGYDAQFWLVAKHAMGWRPIVLWDGGRFSYGMASWGSNGCMLHDDDTYTIKNNRLTCIPVESFLSLVDNCLPLTHITGHRKITVLYDCERSEKIDIATHLDTINALSIGRYIMPHAITKNP